MKKKDLINLGKGLILTGLVIPISYTIAISIINHELAALIGIVAIALISTGLICIAESFDKEE